MGLSDRARSAATVHLREGESVLLTGGAIHTVVPRSSGRVGAALRQATSFVSPRNAVRNEILWAVTTRHSLLLMQKGALGRPGGVRLALERRDIEQSVINVGFVSNVVVWEVDGPGHVLTFGRLVQKAAVQLGEALDAVPAE